MLGTALVLASLLSARGPDPSTCLYTVNTTADLPEATPGDTICETAPGNGVCSLRAAIMTVNGRQLAGCTIVLPAGTFTMTRPPDPNLDDAATGDFDLTISMTIQGAGAFRTTIDANSLDRVFDVPAGVSLALADLSLYHGATSGNGGMIRTDGPVTLDRAFVMVAGAGAGGCIFTTASLHVVDSWIRGCSAQLGGGIFASLGPGEELLVERSSFTGNSATNGGAILAANGHTDVVNSTFMTNFAMANGGALLAAPLSVYSSTIYDNRADHDNDGIGAGGGISTPPDSPALLANSVLAGNHAGVADDDCAGAIVSAGFNLVESQPAGCSVVGTHILSGVQWGSVDGYCYPRADSPVIGGGDPNGCVDSLGALLLVDQRGATRAIGRCDLGAIERGPSGDANGDGAVNVSDVFYLINALFANGPQAKGWVNVDGNLVWGNILDVFYLINYLFAAGPAPIEPP